MFVLTEITTFCITIKFELLVDHGYINHWLLLFPANRLPANNNLVYAGYFVHRVNSGLQLLTTGVTMTL